MYTVNKTRSRKKLLTQVIISLALALAIIIALFWYFVWRDQGFQSANFVRSGGSTVAVVAPATVDFTTDEFKITLPEGWESLGKQRPYSNQEYYEYQSKVKDYENRWLRVYLDVFPPSYPLNRILPITVEGNKIKPGQMSDDCKTFEGAPTTGSGQASSQSWVATWQDVKFTCNMASPINHTGTGSEDEGIGVTVTGVNSGARKYFFVYIDHNVRPQLSILTDAVKSFEAL
jgi:hypothetical protein